MDKPKVDLKKILVGAAVSLVLSGGCIALVLKFTRTQGVWGTLLGVGLSTLLFCVVSVIATWIVDAMRLKVLAGAMGGKISLWDSIKISVMGSFMAGVTPFDTGGEPLKIYFLYRSGLSVGEASAAVALSAFLHATSRLILWLFVPILMLLSGGSWSFTPVVKVTLGVGLGLYLFFLTILVIITVWPQSVEAIVAIAAKVASSKLLSRLVSPSMVETVADKARTIATDFRQGLLRVRSRGRYSILAWLLSLVYWVFVMMVPAFLIKGLGVDAPLTQVFCVTMTIYLVMAFVPTPGSSGGAEFGSALFFAQILPSKLLGVFVVVWRLVTYYFTLAVGGGLVALQTLSWSMRRSRVGDVS